MIGVLEGVAVIGVIVLTGYLCARLGVFSADTANALNRVAFYIATPAILFRILSHADLRVLFSDYMLVAAVSALAAGALYPLTGWLLSPILASLAMALSSVSVVTNALRLRGFSVRQEGR